MPPQRWLLVLSLAPIPAAAFLPPPIVAGPPSSAAPRPSSMSSIPSAAAPSWRTSARSTTIIVARGTQQQGDVAAAAAAAAEQDEEWVEPWLGAESRDVMRITFNCYDEEGRMLIDPWLLSELLLETGAYSSQIEDAAKGSKEEVRRRWSIDPKEMGRGAGPRLWSCWIKYIHPPLLASNTATITTTTSTIHTDAYFRGARRAGREGQNLGQERCPGRLWPRHGRLGRAGPGTCRRVLCVYIHTYRPSIGRLDESRQQSMRRAFAPCPCAPLRGHCRHSLTYIYLYTHIHGLLDWQVKDAFQLEGEQPFRYKVERIEDRDWQREVSPDLILFLLLVG
jgi:hypothetical protein